MSDQRPGPSADTLRKRADRAARQASAAEERGWVAVGEAYRRLERDLVSLERQARR